jgi:hypothetical protein
MSQLQDFDREEELEIFLQMLSAERPERVLDICAGGGMGKSYLLRRMRQECGEQDVPCALAEFERQYDLASDEFYTRFERGELGDATDFVEWSATYEMIQNLEDRLAVLSREGS